MDRNPFRSEPSIPSSGQFDQRHHAHSNVFENTTMHINGHGLSNGKRGNGNGNPPQQNPFVIDMSYLSIGVDLGGSHVTAVVVNSSSGDILVKCTTEVSVADRQDVQCIVDKISECVSTALSENFVENIISSTVGNNLISIGIGVPGNVDPIKGVTRYLPNFTQGWLNEVPLRNALHATLENKVKNVKFKALNMRNDGRCAALAEAKYGAGKFSPVFSMLTLGNAHILMIIHACAHTFIHVLIHTYRHWYWWSFSF